MWKQWINALLGLVTIGVALMGGITSTALGWTLGILGAVVLALSAWTIAEVPPKEYERVAHARHT